MTELSNLQAGQSTKSDYDRIYLLDLLTAVLNNKKMILGLSFVVALFAAGISLLMPNVYTGTTKILPPKQTSSAAAMMLSDIGGLNDLASAGGVGLKSSNDLYVAMLNSRTVADNIIRRFDLNNLYDQKMQSRTRKLLENVTTIKSGKDGVITVEVDDKDPKRAAEMANAYIDELFDLTKVLAVTEASQRRLFFEQQAIQAKDNLVRAEVAVKRALDQGGLVGVETQGQTALEAVARLRAAIAVKEVEIGAMRIYSSEGNAKLKRARQELEVMKREIAKREGIDGTRTANAIDGMTSGIDNLGLLRDLKYYQAVYELLMRQLESAKIDEAKDSAIIQVMDKAIEPDSKSKPWRSMIVLVSAALAFLFGVLWALVQDSMARAAKIDPEGASQRRYALMRSLTWK